MSAGDATVASPAFARRTVSLPGPTAAGGEVALLGIALAGLGAMQDPALRTALLAGLRSSGGGGAGAADAEGDMAA